jgi:hypothetical protein
MARICEPRGPLLHALRNAAVQVLGRLPGGERAARTAQQEEPAWLRGVAATAAGG